MNKNSLRVIHFTLFFLLAKEASSAIDPQFLACLNGPKTCGDDTDGELIFEYPFYIKNQDQAFCGYPGFEVYCDDNRQPILQLARNQDYIIHEIDYENRTLRVSNLAFTYSNTNTNTNTSLCDDSVFNLTLPADSRYELSPHTTNATLLFNCSSSLLPRSLSWIRIGTCSSDNYDDGGVFLLLSQNDSKWVGDACEDQVLVPVDQGGEGNMTARLRNGFVLKWLTNNICWECESSGGKCGFDSQFQCFCSDRPHARSCAHGNGIWELKLKIGLGISAAVAVLIMISVFLVRRKSSLGNYVMFWKKKTESFKNIEVFLEDFGSLCPKRFSYFEIKKITNSFKDKLGEGGFGGVYRGGLQDGRLVAVKVLKGSKGDGEDFINEVSSISRTSHVNVVTLLGFCFEGHKRALVYEFMPNGSLEKFIYEKSQKTSDRQLKWETLYKISVGIARGLEYLHRGCNTRILHFDIKPHNILLDQDFCPKICDFGLAKICPRKESIVSMFGARGTPGYIAPEVFSRNFGGVSHKSDVYSYGMMVLEMVGGRRNMDCGADRTSELYFPQWIYKRLELRQELGLQGITDDEEKEEARKMIIVSMWCIQTGPYPRRSTP